MSTHDEQALTEALRIQAVGAGTPTLTLDDVRGRARGIRRRRAAGVAGGAAALVAAAVLPVALMVGGDSSPDSLPPAVVPTVSDTANPEGSGEPVGQLGSWLEGRTIHPATGEPFEPDVEGEIASTRWLSDGRWLLATYPGTDYALVAVDSRGERLTAYEGVDSGLASDDVGTAVAWLGTDQRVRVLLSGSAEPLVSASRLRDPLQSARLREVLPGCSRDECIVVAEVYDGDQDGSRQVAVGLEGPVQPLDRLGLLSINDLSPDGALVSGLVEADELEMRYCSAVVVFATGEELWRTCDAGTFRFSPDGTRVLGIDPNLDGLGHSFTEVRDALDGTVAGRYEGGTVFDETWATGDSYLVSMQTNAGENLLLRIDADGGEPEVLERVAGTPGDPEGMVRLTG